MKALLLTAAVLLACAGSMFAQNLPPEYDWEVCLNGGLSVMTRPLGPADAYQGTRTNVVHDYSIRLNHYFNEHWMINLDIGNRKWETWGTWNLTDAFGKKLQPREITFLEADNAISSSVAMNYVIPFYTQWHSFNRANLYFGVMIGMVNTMNDGSMGYSSYGVAPDTAYRYTSSYNYGSGIGLSFGAQIGYTYYVIPRLGFNVEVAMRYANIGTHDTRYDSENSRFHLLYFPETVGIKWRF